MKRFTCLILAILILAFPATLLAGAGPFKFVRQSDDETASAAITTKGGYFHGIILVTDGTNAVTLDIYDNASAASGKELIPTTIITSSATDRIQSISIDPPVHFMNGIYVNISVAGQGTVEYMVYFNTEND